MSMYLSLFNQTLSSHLPSVLNEYSWIVFPILFFVDGLLFGLAIRKGVAALILAIIGFAVADFIGLSFLPNFSATQLWNSIYQYASQYTLGTISFGTSVALFVIGLVVGLLKG